VLWAALFAWHDIPVHDLQVTADVLDGIEEHLSGDRLTLDVHAGR
jgi:hypothetical protein